MSEYLPATLAALVLYVAYFWWTHHMRMSDLIKNLTGIHTELRQYQYSIEYSTDERGAYVIELKNSMTRIVLTEHHMHEELLAKRFFIDKEASGANVVHATRSISGGGRERTISWWQQNYLSGRMLYNVAGKTKAGEVHRLIDDILREVRRHSKPT